MTSNSLLCSVCGEDNPPEAVMCWACYRPLGAESETETVAAPGERQPFEIVIHQDAAAIARNALAFAALLAGVASGYLPAYRVLLLGVAVSCFALWSSWSLWDKRISNRHSAEVQAQGEESIVRILDTVLLYAVHDGASQVRLRAGVGVQVHYLINGEWHEQMRIPAYIWKPLCALLLKRTGNWQRPLVFELDGQSFELWPEFQRDWEYPVEVVTLTLHPLS